MSTDTKDKNDENSFEYRLKEVSDEEIISILKYREHFQQQAVKAAIKEALRRGIISSVDDLNSEEFHPQPLQPRSLFPLGTTKKYTFAIFRSLCRLFYFFAMFPLVYSFFQFAEKNFVNGAITFLLGLIVIILSNRLEKTMKPFYANLLLALNILAIGCAIYYYTSLNKPTTMDGIAIAIIILVLLYATLYINKLASYFYKNRDEG